MKHVRNNLRRYVQEIKDTLETAVNMLGKARRRIRMGVLTKQSKKALDQKKANKKERSKGYTGRGKAK